MCPIIPSRRSRSRIALIVARYVPRPGRYPLRGHAALRVSFVFLGTSTRPDGLDLSRTETAAGHSVDSLYRTPHPVDRAKTCHLDVLMSLVLLCSPGTRRCRGEE